MTTQVFKIEASYNTSKSGERQSEPITTREQRKAEAPKVKSNDEITTTDTAGKFSKVVAITASVYAASQVVVNPIFQENINMASVAGDYVQAEAIRRTQQTTNQMINLGLEIGTAVGLFIANPALGLGAGVVTGAKYIQQGFNRNQANRARKEMNNTDNFINSYESSRLIDVKAGR
jgi:hypothetical protein